jgi:hypothetical protein
MPTNSRIREERIKFLTTWAYEHLGDAFHPYDKILSKARKTWPTLSDETVASYARAATRAHLTGGIPVQTTLPVHRIASDPLSELTILR